MTTIAEDLTRLEEIVRRLEADDVELDAALALFEEGVARLRAARERLAAAELKVQTVLEEADGDLRLTRSRWLRPRLPVGRRTCSPRPATLTDRTPATAGPSGSRARSPGRRRRGAGLRARAPRANGSARRSCSASYRAVGGDVAGRSPASRPRSRPCTPTRWCTTTFPAWTTTTSGAAVPPPTARFDVPTATRVGYLLVPVAARVLAAAADATRPPAGRAGPDGGGAVPGRRHRGDGGRAVARPRGRGTDARAGRAHRGPSGQDRSADPGLLHPGRRSRPKRGRPRSPRSRRSARTSASPSRSRTTCWTPPGPARSWARRRAATPQLAKSTYVSAAGRGRRPGGGRAAGPAGGRAPRRGGRPERGAGRLGRVYCDEEFLSQRTPDVIPSVARDLAGMLRRSRARSLAALGMTRLNRTPESIMSLLVRPSSPPPTSSASAASSSPSSPRRSATA